MKASLLSSLYLMVIMYSKSGYGFVDDDLIGCTQEERKVIRSLFPDEGSCVVPIDSSDSGYEIIDNFMSHEDINTILSMIENKTAPLRQQWINVPAPIAQRFKQSIAHGTRHKLQPWATANFGELITESVPLRIEKGPQIVHQDHNEYFEVPTYVGH